MMFWASTRKSTSVINGYGSILISNYKTYRSLCGSVNAKACFVTMCCTIMRSKPISISFLVCH